MGFNEILKRLSGCKDTTYLSQIDELNKKISELNNQVISLNKQIEVLKQNVKIVEPKPLGSLTYGETSTILSKYAKTYFISDEYFNLTSREEATRFCEDTKVKYKQWVINNHDCDNFSFALMGYWSEGLKSFAFGMAWTDAHAFNFMIDDKKRVWVVEPQSNSWTLVENVSNKQMYGTPWRVAIL